MDPCEGAWAGWHRCATDRRLCDGRCFPFAPCNLRKIRYAPPVNGPIPPLPRRTYLQPFAGLPKLRKRMQRREEGHHPRFITFSCQKRLPLFDDPRLARASLCALRSSTASAASSCSAGS